MAKRRLCLGPASVIDCTPLSTLSFWVSVFPGMHGYNTGSMLLPICAEQPGGPGLPPHPVTRPCLWLHQPESQKGSDTSSACTPTRPWPTWPEWQSSPVQPPTFPASVLSSLAALSPCFSPLEPWGTIHSSCPRLQPSLLSGSCLSTLLRDVWWSPKVSSNALLSAPQTFSSPLPTMLIPLLVFESLSPASQGQGLKHLCMCIPSIWCRVDYH